MAEDSDDSPGDDSDAYCVAARALLRGLPPLVTHSILEDPQYTDDDGLIPFAVSGGIASWVYHALQEGRPDEALPVLLVMEDLIHSGAPGAIDLIDTGFVEDFVNIWSHERGPELKLLLGVSGPRLRAFVESESADLR